MKPKANQYIQLYKKRRRAKIKRQKAERVLKAVAGALTEAFKKVCAAVKLYTDAFIKLASAMKTEETNQEQEDQE